MYDTLRFTLLGRKYGTRFRNGLLYLAVFQETKLESRPDSLPLIAHQTLLLKPPTFNLPPKNYCIFGPMVAFQTRYMPRCRPRYSANPKRRQRL
jgi:hypothetical protein